MTAPAGPVTTGSTSETGATRILRILTVIGQGDPDAGLSALCVTARICPACGQSWDNPAYRCACTTLTVLPASAAEVVTRG